MKFVIYQCKNGYLLNVIYSKGSSESFIYTEQERMTMFSKIDKILGKEPEDAVGKELEDKN